jgi:hypothetical protein
VFNYIPPELTRPIESPIPIMKTIKNETEIQGMLNSHYKDNLSLITLFAEIDNKVQKKRVVREY